MRAARGQYNGVRTAALCAVSASCCINIDSGDGSRQCALSIYRDRGGHVRVPAPASLAALRLLNPVSTGVAGSCASGAAALLTACNAPQSAAVILLPSGVVVACVWD